MDNNMNGENNDNSQYRYSGSNIPYNNETYNNEAYGNSTGDNSAYNQENYNRETYSSNMNNTNNINNNSSYSNFQTEGNVNASKKKNKKRSKGFVKKACAAVVAAVLLGAVAGSTMYGVYYAGSVLFPAKKTAATENISTVAENIASVTANVSADDTDLTNVGTTMNVQTVAQAALPAMVELNGTATYTSSSSYGGFGGQTYEAVTSGTGIIVGKNDTELLILTNAHVVKDVSNLKCVFIDGESVSCSVKGSKSDQDIAVVSANLSDIKSDTASKIAIAELGDSTSLSVGQQVVAIGNALGEGQSVTTGIISATDRSITVNNTTFSGLIMTDAAINSGNSGGALLNASGKVIAINFAKTSEDGVEGMAYSIPVSNVKDLIDSLMNRQTRNKVSSDKQSYLGIAGIDVTASVTSMYGYPQGVLIRKVAEGSPAEKAGLSAYDIIVGFDDQTVTTMTGLTSTLQYYEAGETVTIEYYHLEKNEYVKKSVEVTLGNKN